MKTAIVTGANSEIGFDICKMLIKEEYKVIACIHLNDDRIKEINSENLFIKKIDLTNEEEIINLLKNIEVNLIVNCAAYYFDDFYKEISKENFMKTLEVNVVAPFLLAKYANLKGIIINISSTDGIDTYNDINIPYSVSKAALNNLTKSLAYTLKSNKVYALALGWVNTELIRSINQDYLLKEMERTGQKRLVEIDEIEEFIKKMLVGDYKTGSIIRIDGDINVY